MTVASREAPISGLQRVKISSSRDERGSFHKIFAQDREPLTGFRVAELFWTQSATRVIRGMHLQLPPQDGKKIVWVTRGTVCDVVIDLRVDSETFGNFVKIPLSPQTEPLLIPAGCAHGYEVIDGPAQVHYAQECLYSPVADTGIRFDSFGMPWETKHPIVSQRDRDLPTFEDFLSTLDPQGPL